MRVANHGRTEMPINIYLPSLVYFELVQRLANVKDEPGRDRADQIKEILGLVADIWPATIREDAEPAQVIQFRR